MVSNLYRTICDNLGAFEGAIDTGEVLYLPFDEASGDTCYDQSSNSNNGTFNPSGGPTRVSGKYGRAVSFDGSDDYVSVPYSASLWGFTAFTVTCWIYPNVVGYSRGLMNLKGASSTQYFTLQIWNSIWYTELFTSTGGKALAPATPAPVAGQWAHLALTWDGATMILYLNGSPIASGARDGALTSTGNILEMGIYNGSDHPLNGLMDEVRIYNRALSASEITTLYNTNALPVKSKVAISTRTTELLSGLDRIQRPFKYFIDMQIYNWITNTSTYLTDMIIKKIGKDTYSIDARVILKQLERYLSDIAIRKKDLTRTDSIDVYLTKAPTLSTIINSGGSLTFKPIEWGEKQKSEPAVRDVPWRTTQLLDTGSWVLKARTIECTFRLTDAEKDTLNAIFAAEKMCTIYLRPPLDYGTYGWIYTAWLKEKNITFEYVIDDLDSSLRWWKVKASFDVKTFIYEAVM